MAWGWYDDDMYPRPSRPRAVKGGIKAHSKRGAFGESWWARRWIAVLESFNIGARLGRGRSYARTGQVLSIAIDQGRVEARVQGSRPKPYDIRITLKALSAADWKTLVKVLSQQAIFAAKLLAGEMPQDIETVFKDAGLSLFPLQLRDLETKCSCPDWSNPCKHIAAVYYLLGEEFDRDPFLLFKLRGMSREELIDLLGRAGATASTRKPRDTAITPGAGEGPSLPPEPLMSDRSAFWGGANLPDGLFGEVRVPPVPGALLKRLGNFPFWRSEERFLDALEPLYAHASPHGLDIFLGEHGSASVGSQP